MREIIFGGCAIAVVFVIANYKKISVKLGDYVEIKAEK